MNDYNYKPNEQDLNELNDQFKTFLKTKGIKAKYDLVVENLKENTKKQHEIDKANFEEVKQKSYEDNKEFVEFLKTKGIKAKFKLAFKNMKESAKNARVDVHKPNPHVYIPNVNAYNPHVQVNAQTLTSDFEGYLKSKGLDKKYKVEIVEVDE